jgi:hypothetical protein
MPRLRTFTFEGVTYTVRYSHTEQVCDGVECDVYELVGCTTMDMGVIRIGPKGETPEQLVLEGDRTVEGFISGEGTLKIKRAAGGTETYVMDGSPFSIDVCVGDTMQWVAGRRLEAYEMCKPPYAEGRFRNLT